MSRHNSEGGYTLQTLIIIAILVLGATTASVILYAVLRDSTSRIAGGSETFDGYPSGPQNLRVMSEASEPDPADPGNHVDVTISWEAPSYLGEFPLTGYELSVTKDDLPELSHIDSDWDCGGTSGVSVLATTSPDFTYDNSCEGTVTSFDGDADYELVFTINLGSADARSSPGGLTFYRELNLSTGTPPPDSPQVKPLPEAVEISWDAASNVVYRLHIEPDYYQCFESTGGVVTREVPNIRNRSGTEDGTTPTEKTEYKIEISASKPNPPVPLNSTFCSGDNFGRSVEITAKFGTPPIPEMTLETESTRMEGRVTLASLKATLEDCESDMSTTFYWEEAGKPETQRSHTIAGCGSTTPPCTSDCEFLIYGDFIVGNEYELWAVTSNDVGANSPTPRQPWIPSGTSGVPQNPGAPQNVNTYSGGSGIVVVWDAPNFIHKDGISGYFLRAVPKTMPTCPSTLTAASRVTCLLTQEAIADGVCPSTLTVDPQITPAVTLQVIPAETLQDIFLTSSNHQKYCFQLSAFYADDSNSTNIESSRVVFESIYVNPVTERGRADEFRLKWITQPRAKYYTIRWAPLAQDTACSVTSGLDDPALQPQHFLSKTLRYDGEESMSYTIPAIINIQYLLLFTAILNDNKSYSWTSYACATLYNAPMVTAPTWTGTTTAGDPIGIQWTKPDLNATDYDNRNGPYSYALRVTLPDGTTVDRCIAFDSNLLTDTSTGKEYQITISSVAGEYRYSLTAVPSRDCSSASDATSVIDSPPAATPPIRTGSQTVS